LTNDRHPTPAFDRQPGYPFSFLPVDGRIRVEFNGETIADSARTMIMDEDGHRPVYYFPPQDVRMDLLHRTEHSTH
jgi:uncharacterized protein (DUF427 family)